MLYLKHLTISQVDFQILNLPNHFSGFLIEELCYRTPIQISNIEYKSIFTNQLEIMIEKNSGIYTRKQIFQTRLPKTHILSFTLTIYLQFNIHTVYFLLYIYIFCLLFKIHSVKYKYIEYMFMNNTFLKGNAQKKIFPLTYVLNTQTLDLPLIASLI